MADRLQDQRGVMLPDGRMLIAGHDIALDAEVIAGYHADMLDAEQLERLRAMGKG